MNIGIDARLIAQTGVGRYIRNLIGHLALVDKENTYIVFLRKEEYDSFALPAGNWQKRLLAVRWHTIAEQFVVPFVVGRERLDVYHVPYFSIPIFYPGRMVVTIHDVILNYFPTGNASTLPPLFYWVRRMGYDLVMRIGLARAAAIVSVTKTTKKEIQKLYGVPESKLHVTLEGVDPAVSDAKKGESVIDRPYFLYVGNVYPHKNVNLILAAIKKVNKAYVVFVGKEDIFYTRLRKKIEELNAANQVRFFGEATDSELVSLYDHALALVVPSFMEGFGLPAIEAISRGCPVLVSDIAVFHEVLGESATYFNPQDADSLAVLLTRYQREKPAGPRAKDIAKQYNWQSLANKTREIYERSARL